MKSEETVKYEPTETFGISCLLIDGRRYIDLSEWDMSCEFRESIDVRDLSEELGTNHRPRK